MAETVKPRRSARIRVSVLATAVGGGVLALLVWGATAGDVFGGTEQVDCAKAMEFSRGTLPVSAVDGRCTSTSGFGQETRTEAEFRMDREEYEPWLTSTYPEQEVLNSCEDGRDACVEVAYADILTVKVDVAYEDGDTALVRVSSTEH